MILSLSVVLFGSLELFGSEQKKVTPKNKDIEKTVSTITVDQSKSDKLSETKETREKVEILDALHIAVQNYNPTIKVMQYNVDQAIQEEQYENTQWIRRSPRNIRLINEVNADIVCLNELRGLANNQSVNRYLAEFDQYYSVFSHRGPSKTAFGNATLYKFEQFFPIKNFPKWLSDTPNEVSDTWNMRKDCAFGAIVLCTKFMHVHQERIIKNAKPFWVFNVHFANASEDIKTKSCKTLLEIIKKYAKKNPYVVCGDFNFFEDGDGATQREILAKEMLDCGKDAVTLGGKKLERTHIGFQHHNKKADLTNLNKGGSRLDYVWASPGAERIGNALLYTKTMLDAEPEELTSYDLPSDHLPLIVSLKLSGPQKEVEKTQRNKQDDAMMQDICKSKWDGYPLASSTSSSSGMRGYNRADLKANLMSAKILIKKINGHKVNLERVMAAEIAMKKLDNRGVMNVQMIKGDDSGYRVNYNGMFVQNNC